MSLPRHRLPRWQRRGLYLSGLVVLVTGVAWLAVHYTLGAGAGQLPHPLEAWSLRLHGLGAFAALFMAGVLAAAHIPRGWRWLDAASPAAPPHATVPRGARQRALGIGLCVFGVALALTGYMLYYFAPEPWRPALGWVHAGVGIAMAALLLGHRRGL